MNVTLPNGQVIQGVPEGTPKEVIMQKAIAAGMATEADFAQSTQSQVQPATQPATQPAQQDPSLWEKTKDVFTGNLRETPEMTARGMINNVAILGTPKQQIAFDLQTATMFNPDEIAKVATQVNPDLQVRYNKDAQGKVYPILTNPKTGQSSMINMPGLDAMDVTKGLTTGALFTRGKGGGGLLKQAGQAAAHGGAVQTAIEGQHALSGGDFDVKDIALSAAMGGVGEAVPMAASALWKKAKGMFSGADDVVSKAGKPPKKRGQTRRWELNERQRAQVEALKQGYEAKKGALSGPEKLEQMKQALASGDEARVAAMVEIDDEYLTALKELGLQERGLISASTPDIQMQQIEQGLKKIPGSDLARRESAQIAELQQKADDLILEFGGSTDKTAVGENLLRKVQDNIKSLGDETEVIYDGIRDSIPNQARSDMANIGDHLRQEFDDVGRDLSQFSPLEKQLLKMSEEGATYKALDKIRKKVGAKLGGTSTAFQNEDTATLKKLYSLLTDDQEVVANQFGMAEAWNTGKELTKRRKILEDDAITMYGSDLSKSFMTDLNKAVTSLKSGDYKNFKKLMDAVPKKDRQEVLITALKDGAFTRPGAKDTQLSLPDFANWHKNLSQNPRLKAGVYGYLPPKLAKQLDALGKVSDNIRNARAQETRGGQFLATPGALDNLINGVSKKVLVNFIGKMPGFGIVGDITEAGISKGQTKNADNALKMLSSPEFTASIKALAQGQTDKAAKLEKQLMKTRAFKEYLKTLAKEEQNLILRQGFGRWLAEDEENGNN